MRSVERVWRRRSKRPKGRAGTGFSVKEAGGRDVDTKLGDEPTWRNCGGERGVAYLASRNCHRQGRYGRGGKSFREPIRWSCQPKSLLEYGVSWQRDSIYLSLDDISRISISLGVLLDDRLGGDTLSNEWALPSLSFDSEEEVGRWRER